MTCTDCFLNNVLLPGLIALTVSLITIYIKERISSKSDSKKELLLLCKEIRKTIFKTQPECYEEDFTYSIKEIESQINNAKYFNGDKVDLIKEKVKNMKYSFTSLTNKDIDNAKKQSIREQINNTICEIESCIKKAK